MPYPHDWQERTEVSDPKEFRVLIDASTQGLIAAYKSDGFMFIRTEQHKPGEPYDWFFNPTYAVMRSPRETYLFSPIGHWIHKVFFDGLSSLPLSSQSFRKNVLQENSRIHTEMAKVFFDLMDKGKNPQEVANALGHALRKKGENCLHRKNSELLVGLAEKLEKGP